MGNRIDVTKGSAAGAGADGVLSYNPSSIEDSLKASLAGAKSSGWKTVAVEAPQDAEALRSAFSAVADFLFGNDTPQTVLFACADDATLKTGKELVEETFS